MSRVRRQVDAVVKAPEDRRLYRGVELANELRVLLISDGRAEQCAAALDVRVGHMSDPAALPGLAHLCEHALFLGSSKYPRDDECSSFLAAHRGGSGADTCPDHTNYYFHIAPEHFRDALDRFAHCLKCPLFSDSAVDREINDVNEEHEENLLNDSWRLDQLDKSTSDGNHPFSKFGAGNRLTLDVIPKKKGINVLEELRKFYETWYSSNIMSICVMGKDSLDELQEMVVELLSDIENKHVIAPHWTKHPFGPEQLQMKCYVLPIADISTLDVRFPTPDLDEYYRAGPGHYLSYLFEQEGPGSLLSLLKAKGWSTKLKADSRSGYKNFGFFGIDIHLTETGVFHVDDIIKLVFQYINMLKREGPHEWIFNELRDIKEMEFRLKKESMSTDYVANLSENLHLFPLEEALSGDYLIKEWRPDIIEMIMSYLSPENIRVAVISRQFENQTDQIEEWYGTNYKIEKIPEATINEWKQAVFCSDLKLPQMNEFITNDFSLLPSEKNLPTYPIVIQDTPIMKVWFKQDDAFLLPEAELTFEFVSSWAYVDPETCNMTAMLVNLFQNSLSEYMHAVEVAGIIWGVEHTKYGMVLDIGGCSSKQHILLEKIMEKLINFKIDQERLNDYKEYYMRQLMMMEHPQPVDHSLALMEVLLEEKAWTTAELLTAMNELRLEQFEAFIPQFLSRMHVECLIHGNVDIQRALQMANLVEDRLRSSVSPVPLLPNQLLRHRGTKLLEGGNWVLEVYNCMHETSGAAVYYQCGMASTESDMLLALIVDIIREPCFTQLPHVVSCDSRKYNGVHGLRIIAHSDMHPKSMEHSIENFLVSMKYLIRGLNEEEFGRRKEHLAAQRAARPRSLAGLTARFWREILSQEYCFDRPSLEVACLGTVKKEEVAQFYERYIACGSPHRSRLAVNVLPAAKGDAGDAGPAGCLSLDYKEPTKIKDITNFKLSQGLFPRVIPFLQIPMTASETCNHSPS